MPFNFFFGLCLLLGLPLAQADVAQLKKSVEYLASAELAGRGIGTEGHRLAREYIVERLQKLGYAVEIHNEENKDPDRPNVNNIIARSNSEPEPKRCLVLTAHYDHMGVSSQSGKHYPGANDNASGVAILLDMAARLKHLDTSNTQVLFTFPDDEEHMLAGSSLMVPHLKKTCKNIILNINLDILGTAFFPGMENTVLALGAEYGEQLGQVLANTDQAGVNIIKAPVYMIELLGIPRSDYASFRWHQIPFIFYTAGTPYHYHTTKDSPEKIDYQMMKRLSDHLSGLAINVVEQREDYKFQWLPKTDIREDAEKLCVILDKLLANKDKNKLSGAEIEYFELMRQFLRFPYSPISKTHIHQTVGMLIRTVGSKQLD